MNHLEIYSEIYENIYINIFNHYFFIFLCGGAGKNCIRNKIRKYLEINNTQVLYPEDLFMNMLNKNKNTDLLEYENLLADNSDIICIICESMGSSAELGAFIQNDDLENKLIVCINHKFSRDKSFIMIGPVKHLRKKNSSSILTYRQEDPDSLGEEIIKEIKHFKKNAATEKSKKITFNNLSPYILIIPIILYFYKSEKRNVIFKTLRELLDQKKLLPENYKDLFNIAINYLIKSGKIITKLDDLKYDETLSLSSKGYSEITNNMNNSIINNKRKLQDRIRCAILKEQLNN